MVPKRIRIWAYHNILQVLKWLYPRESSRQVKSLPFGLFIKRCRYSNGNEPNALKVVEKYTSIPAPLLIDTFQDELGDEVFIMTRLRGHTLSSVFHRMSYKERGQLAHDISECVKQLRCIPNWTPYRFASAIGGLIIDHRIPDGKGGPFKTESDFNKHLVHRYVGEETKNFIAVTHSRDHRSFFAHADLHMSNILIDRGRLSGLVDWECAGYYPEYWEFTKAMFGVWNVPDREKIWRNSFGHDYDEELKAEQRLWRETPLGI